MVKRIVITLAVLLAVVLAARFGYEAAEVKYHPPVVPEVSDPAWRDPFWRTTYTAEEWAGIVDLQCPAGMVLIPAGSVDSVWDPRSSHFKRKLGEPRAVAAYCMDRFEYPNERYALPRTKVSWREADQLCRAAGKRLCAEDEWELACTMGRGWRFTYGPEYVPHRCNTEQPVGTLQAIAPTGARFECRNRFAVFDLNGNVSEWVAEPIEYRNGAFGVVRGGTAWRGAEYGGDCFSRHTHPVDDACWEDDGFRCCADPQPK
ncbi:MAG: SUMF1/EgtB/PvdO family nonheme iron enzyme [Candidatus Lernaella stagnicola]|nr:SUMF1/EgtB/PvdO family nonheme iron enzyme [Candidatus Lernaella stagnicola]